LIIFFEKLRIHTWLTSYYLLPIDESAKIGGNPYIYNFEK
jgi:hypothetical protein